MRESLILASCYSRKLLPNSTRWVKTDGDESLLQAENMRFLESIRKPKPWQLFQQEWSLDQSLRFIFWKFLTRMDWKLRFHQSVDLERLLMLWHQERLSVLRTKFIITTQTSDPVRKCSIIFKNQKKVCLTKGIKVTTRHKETWAAPSIEESRAGSLTLVPKTASLYTGKTNPTNEKKWTTIHAHSGRGSDLAVFISETVTTMLRHFDQDERETDGSRHWDSKKSTLWRSHRLQWRNMVTKDLWR